MPPEPALAALGLRVSVLGCENSPFSLENELLTVFIYLEPGKFAIGLKCVLMHGE